MIEELRRFILVAKNGNVSRTAEQIFITQSALSQSIKRLEKELKAKLFIQKGKSLHITSEGKAVVEIGTKILELWEKAKNPQIIINQPTFAIGLFDNAALRLGKYLAQGSKSRAFNFEIKIDSSDKLLSQLQLGILDIAICVIDKNYLYTNALVLIQKFSEKLVAVSSKKFNDDIKKIPFILFQKGSSTRSQIDKIFIKNNIVPNVFAESTSITFMKELAILGSGIALLPENYIQTEIKTGILKKQKLPLKFNREYGIFINQNETLQEDDIIIKDIIKHLS